MTDRPIRLVVHVGDTKRGQTLGVAHFAANTIAALACDNHVQMTIVGQAGVVEDYRNGRCSVVTLEELQDARRRHELEVATDAALQIHHFLPRIVDVPTMAIVHDLHLYDVAWKYSGSEAHLHRLLTANLHESVAVLSEFPRTITALVEREPNLGAKSRVLPSPTLLSDFEVTEAARDWARSRFRLDDGVPCLLYPSQLQAHKNHWNLIAAIGRLRDAGRPMRVVLTGSSFRDHLTAALRLRVRQLDLVDLVTFAGHITGEQLRSLYMEVDAVISPSLAEGGAYIAQEAIVHRCPVGCSSLESVRAHLDRLEVDVPLFDPYDVEAIRHVCTRLVDDGPAIVNGYDRALEIERSWTWERVAAAIVETARDTVPTPEDALQSSVVS